MYLKELRARVEQLPQGSPRAMLEGIVEILESISQSGAAGTQQVASLRQELDVLKGRPSHMAGLCDEDTCKACRNAEIAVAQATKDEVVTLFDEAARRYGLQQELLNLAEAVKHNQANDADWQPPGHSIPHLTWGAPGNAGAPGAVIEVTPS